MIKNIILILLTILSITVVTFYIEAKSNEEQQKEYSEKLERKIQEIFTQQINGIKREIEEIDINLESSINSNQKDKEYINLLQEVLEQEKLAKLLDKSQSNQVSIDIQIFEYRKIIQSYEDLKTSLESVKKIIKNKNKEKDITSKVIQENNETERNKQSNNQVKIEELDKEEPIKVIFSNSNIKSEEEDNITLEKLFDKLENNLNIYSTKTMKRVPRYNLLKFVRECKKIIKERETREIIHEFIKEKNVCKILKNIQLREKLDIRIIKKQNENIRECYVYLENLTYPLENIFTELVVEYENFSSNSNNLEETDLIYFKNIVKNIDMISSIIALEKQWINLNMEDLGIKVDEI
ncbi:Uncharacterized protein MJ1254 [hydrothermal vent metagenome]|uniref:Uncharacterized protein MJ1254 n=1 Tax=hydrothermal vent metagenome TaxID=652676 RepID=A0A1W1C3K3_9ZZZZ